MLPDMPGGRLRRVMTVICLMFMLLQALCAPETLRQPRPLRVPRGSLCEPAQGIL
jgi:hypothetical protein